MPSKEKQELENCGSIINELSEEIKLPYNFKFIALTEGKFNGIWYPKEELKKGFLSLKGKNVTLDHGKSVRDVVGKVEDVWWNEVLGRIEGRGIVEDRNIAEKIQKGLITGVSVEVLVGYEKTSAHGVEAREPEFQAISLVQNPACKPPNCGIIV